MSPPPPFEFLFCLDETGDWSLYFTALCFYSIPQSAPQSSITNPHLVVVDEGVLLCYRTPLPCRYDHCIYRPSLPRLLSSLSGREITQKDK